MPGVFKIKIINKLSLLSLFISIIVIGNIYIKYSSNYVMSWDVYGYYLYLPQAMIHNDLCLENDSVILSAREKYPVGPPFYQRAKSELGYWVIKYPLGMNYLYLPAFLTGHAIAYIADYKMDGFSKPYENSMWVLCFISIIAGLIYVRKILLHIFDDRVSAIALMLIALGTNYLSTVTLSVAMPHNFLFTLFALSLWNTIKWWETNKIKYAILIGVFLGISIAARFTSAIFIIIPVFWGVKLSWADIWKRIVFIFSKKIKHFLTIGVLTVLFFVPQMIYWKVYSGQWIYDSYQNPGEGLDLLSPRTMNFLFSYRKGWLLYTPIMVFAFIGLFSIRKKRNDLLFPVLLFIIVNIWVLSSWTTWWYGESFSQRPVIDSYPLMALILGFFIDGLFRSGKLIKWSGIVLLFITMSFTLFQNWQYNRGIIEGSRMTKDYYWAVFGKTQFEPALDSLLFVKVGADEVEVLKNESDYDRKILCNYSFDGFDEYWDPLRYDTTKFVTPRMSFRLDENVNFSPDFRMPSSAFMNGDHAWIRASVWVYPTEDVIRKPVWLVITFLHDGKCYKYFASDKASSQMIPDQWNNIKADYLIPMIRNERDELQIYVWSQAGQKAYIDNMKVFVYSPKQRAEE